MLCRSLIKAIIKLNIFDKHTQDEHKQRNGRLSTKLYIIILFVCFAIFSAYLSLETQSKTMFIYNPTRIQFEQLQNQSVNDIHCPCSQISIKYSQVINLKPTYHQLCSSIFISDLWFNAYELWNVPNPCYYPSFQNLASSYISLLSTYCQSANETVKNGLTQFYALDYITSQVIVKNQFNGEMISLIELFQTKLQNSFRDQWNLLQSVLFNNQIITLRKTSFILSVKNINDTIVPYSNLKKYHNCTCGTNPTCHETVQFCTPARQDFITGIYVGCYLVDSVLMSTTDFLFNQESIDIMKSYMKTSAPLYQQLTILNSSTPSEYQTNETIGTIVKNLFIEKWNEFYSYDNYYNQCKPSLCSYTIEQRLNFIDVLTKVIAVYGGLTIIIQFLVPTIVNLIRRKKREQSGVLTSNRLSRFMNASKTKLFAWNLFRDRSTNPDKIHKQILTTRLYLIVLNAVLCILVLYTSLNRKSISVNVSLSSSKQYQQLQMKYPNTLTCPCNQISIEYNKFIELGASYHVICSSDFMTQEWFDYLYDDQKINERNFHATASSQFQTLASLCKLTQETLNTSLTQFYSRKFVSDQIIFNASFQNQIDSIVTIFRKSVSQTFKQTLDMIHGIIHANFYMSSYQTNWKFTILQREPYSPIYTNPVSYNKSCSCGTSSECFQSVVINNSIIDGLFIGCYPVQSMLQSSLQCLYNQSCFNLILADFGTQNQKNVSFRILQKRNAYEIDEKVEQMVDRLFVDQWFINHSYEKYYQECHSTMCTYSYIENFNIFYIVTTILGLYGGLTIVLKLLIPFLMHLIIRLCCKRGIPVEQCSQTGDQHTN